MQIHFKGAPASLHQEPYTPTHPRAARAKSWWGALAWGFVVAGMLLRLFHFFDNRSFWVDEAYLSNSIIRMGFIDLATSALEYEQKAPIGFLWASKLMVMLFGKGEMALRLIPLLGGLGSLILFMRVARYFLKPIGVTAATGVLALAPQLVFHGVEAKQYSTELFFTVVALYLYTRFHNRLDTSSLLAWGLCGAAALWFSHAVIFVLAGVSFAVCLQQLLVNQEGRKLFFSVVPFSMWLASFAVNYFCFTSRHSASEWLITWFGLRGGFMPLLPASQDEVLWFLQTPYRMLDYPLGILWNFEVLDSSAWLLPLKMPLLMFGFIGAGMAAMCKRNRELFMVLLFPLLLTLLASGLRLYPFYQRLLVFLVPLIILYIGYGCQVLVGYGSRYSKAAYIMPVLLLVAPVWGSATQAANPPLFGDRKNSTEREGLVFIQENFQKGDVVYVFWNMQHAYRYYKESHSLAYEAVEGLDIKNQAKDKKDYYARLQPDLSAIAKGQRVWVICHRTLKLNIGDYDGRPTWYHAEEAEPGDMLREKLATMGKLTESLETRDVAVHLYDLTAK